MSSEATLCWKDVKVSAKNTKGVTRHILRGVSGCASPGQLHAIMGPSGCGKSTLLDTLAGRLAGSATLEGKITVNGHGARLAYGKSAYVTQDEVLIGVLSVRETILYAARLRLAGDETMHCAVADSVISDLGLAEVANTAIGTFFMRGISGGQRRRVAIGCELVVSPTLLFLDEPTSGLDAAAAFHVMSVVHKLCTTQRRTVLAVIHQPAGEVFELFDTLTLLAEGHTVFVGPAAQAGTFYETAGFPCPAMRSTPDHLLHTVNADFDLTARQNVETLVAAYGASPLGLQVAAQVDASHDVPQERYEAGSTPPSAWRQTVVLTERALLNNLRDPVVFGLRCAMFVMLCLCIGFIYFQLGPSWKDIFSRTALLFFTTAFLTFMSVSSFPAFTEDMKVFLRERMNGYYSVASFVAANTLSALPFLAVISFASALPVYWLAGLNPEAGRFFYFVFNLFMALLVTESMMMAMAPLLPHFLVGIAAGAGALGLFMLTCGFFQPASQLPRPVFYYPLHFLSFETYSFYGFLVNEFGGTHGWGCPCSAQPGGCPPALGGAACALSGAEVLAYWDVPQWNKWYVAIVVQGAFAVFYRLCFYLACKYKEKSAH